VTTEFVIANALILKHVLTEQQVPQHIANAMLSAGLGRVMFLVVVNIILLIGGQFMDGNGTMFRPYLRVGLTAYNRDDMNIGASFTNAPAGVAPFTVGNRFDKLFGNITAGLDILSTDGLTLKLDYEGRFAEHTRQHAGSIKLGFRF